MVRRKWSSLAVAVLVALLMGHAALAQTETPEAKVTKLKTYCTSLFGNGKFDEVVKLMDEGLAVSSDAFLQPTKDVALALKDATAKLSSGDAAGAAGMVESCVAKCQHESQVGAAWKAGLAAADKLIKDGAAERAKTLLTEMRTKTPAAHLGQTLLLGSSRRLIDLNELAAVEADVAAVLKAPTSVLALDTALQVGGNLVNKSLQQEKDKEKPQSKALRERLVANFAAGEPVIKAALAKPTTGWDYKVGVRAVDRMAAQIKAARGQDEVAAFVVRVSEGLPAAQMTLPFYQAQAGAYLAAGRKAEAKAALDKAAPLAEAEADKAAVAFDYYTLSGLHTGAGEAEPAAAEFAKGEQLFAAVAQTADLLVKRAEAAARVKQNERAVALYGEAFAKGIDEAARAEKAAGFVKVALDANRPEVTVDTVLAHSKDVGVYQRVVASLIKKGSTADARRLAARLNEPGVVAEENKQATAELLAEVDISTALAEAKAREAAGDTVGIIAALKDGAAKAKTDGQTATVWEAGLKLADSLIATDDKVQAKATVTGLRTSTPAALLSQGRRMASAVPLVKLGELEAARQDVLAVLAHPESIGVAEKALLCGGAIRGALWLQEKEREKPATKAWTAQMVAALPGIEQVVKDGLAKPTTTWDNKIASRLLGQMGMLLARDKGAGPAYESFARLTEGLPDAQKTLPYYQAKSALSLAAGQLAEAETALGKAVALAAKPEEKEDLALQYETLGNVYAKGGEAAKSAAAFAMADELLGAMTAEQLASRAIAAAESGGLERALGLYDQAFKKGFDEETLPGHLSRFKKLAVDSGRPTLVVDVLLAGSKNVATYVSVAKALLKNGEYADARRLAAHLTAPGILTVEADQQAATELLAEVDVSETLAGVAAREEAGDLGGAALKVDEALAKVKTADQTNRVWQAGLRVVNKQVQTGGAAAARALLDKLRTKTPEALMTQSRLISTTRVLVKLGDLETAEADVTKVMSAAENTQALDEALQATGLTESYKADADKEKKNYKARLARLAALAPKAEPVVKQGLTQPTDGGDFLFALRALSRLDELVRRAKGPAEALDQFNRITATLAASQKTFDYQRERATVNLNAQRLDTAEQALADAFAAATTESEKEAVGMDYYYLAGGYQKENNPVKRDQQLARAEQIFLDLPVTADRLAARGYHLERARNVEAAMPMDRRALEAGLAEDKVPVVVDRFVSLCLRLKKPEAAVDVLPAFSKDPAAYQPIVDALIAKQRADLAVQLATHLAQPGQISDPAAQQAATELLARATEARTKRVEGEASAMQRLAELFRKRAEGARARGDEAEAGEWARKAVEAEAAATAVRTAVEPQ